MPEDYGARFYANLARSGVKLRIVTNSLASTNHAYVHGGYARHRTDLLAAGVELYELRHDAIEALNLTDAENPPHITLHTKLAVIDDTSVLLGSLNLDPRSIKTNAEIGLLVESPAYARSILTNLDKNLADFAYKVTARDTGLQWKHQPKTVAPTVVDKDPDAGIWRRFMSVLPQWFGLEVLT